MRHRTPSQTSHEKMQKLKKDFEIAPETLSRMVKLLRIAPGERTAEEVEFLIDATKDFSFFWKYKENNQPNSLDTLKQCCRHLCIENYSKGSIIIRQGDEGDKMFFLLKGEVDVYIRKTEQESQEYRQQFESESSSPTQLHKMTTTILPKTRSPRRVARLTCPPKESSPVPSIPTDGDSSPVSAFEPIKTTEGGESEKSQTAGSAPQISLWSKVRKYKPNVKFMSKPNSKGMMDIKELAYFSNLDAIKSDKELLWDDCFHLKYLNTLKSGSIFGEMALTTEKKRAATIIAIEDCVLGVLYRGDFNRILKAIEKSNLDKNLDFYRKALAINISQEGMIKLSRMFHEEKVVFRQTIFNEGDSADGFYIVKSGKVLIYKSVGYPVSKAKEKHVVQKFKEIQPRGSSIEGKNTKTFTLKYPIQEIFKGELLGDEVLAGQEKRVFTAECQSETGVLLYIPFEKFERFFTRLKEIDRPLSEKAIKNFKLVQERLEGAEKYIKQLEEISRPPEPKRLTYTQRVATNKIDKLHSILNHRARTPPPQRTISLDYNNGSSIFMLSEVRTPNFSRNYGRSQEIEFIRCHKTNEDALETSCDTVVHINDANEKTLSQILRNCDQSHDPFVLKEYPFDDPKRKAWFYRKGRSLTPENKEKFFLSLGSAEKSRIDSNRTNKENILSTGRCRRLLHRLLKSNRKSNSIKLDGKTPERSDRELKEKSFIKEIATRSSSSPALSHAKGSFLSIMTLRGRNQRSQSPFSLQVQPNQSPISLQCFYTPQPSISNEVEVNSFTKWSEKEKEAYLSGKAISSDKVSSNNALLDENDRTSQISFPFSDEKFPIERIPKLFRRKSFEGNGNIVARAKKQLDLVIRGKKEEIMHVIEEERQVSPSRNSSAKPRSRPSSRQKGPEGGDPGFEQPKLVKSTRHSMFRFRNIDPSKKKPKILKLENIMNERQSEKTIKTIDIEFDMKRDTRPSIERQSLVDLSLNESR